MLAKVRSAAVQGLDAYPIDVEVDVGGGLPAFAIVGLPDTAVQEAKERVRAAIRNSNYEVPARKITVNLAPADVRKEGPAFDLPMAVGILAATEQIRARLDGTVLLGELSLDGGVRPVTGVLSIALAARALGLRGLIVPRDNAAEAALVGELDIYPAASLGEVLRHLEGEAVLSPVRVVPESTDAPELDVDFSEVKGQEQARRAMEIAAAGGHNILYCGTHSVLAKHPQNVLRWYPPAIHAYPIPTYVNAVDHAAEQPYFILESQTTSEAISHCFDVLVQGLTILNNSLLVLCKRQEALLLVLQAVFLGLSLFEFCLDGFERGQFIVSQQVQ